MQTQVTVVLIIFKGFLCYFRSDTVTFVIEIRHVSNFLRVFPISAMILLKLFSVTDPYTYYNSKFAYFYYTSANGKPINVKLYYFYYFIISYIFKATVLVVIIWQLDLQLPVKLVPITTNVGPRICSTCRKHFPVLSSFMNYHRGSNQSNPTGATSGARTAYPSGAPEFIPGFQWGSCYSIFRFMCMFLQIVVCPFVLFLLAILFSVLLRYTDSDYPFVIFKLFLEVRIPLMARCTRYIIM